MYHISAFIYVVLLLINILELKRTTHWAPISIPAILSLAILLSFIPIILPLILVFGSYRLLVQIILKIKHGKDFYGLLSGADTFHVVGKDLNVLEIVCFMVKCVNHTSEEFYEIWREIVMKASVVKKFHTSFCKSFGYPYLVKRKLNLSKDCMTKMNVLKCTGKRMDKQQFYELLNYHYNLPMPEDGRIPFHCLVGTQPVNWKDDNCDYYPVMFKVHHGVADAVSLFKTFVAATSDGFGIKKTINHLNTHSNVKRNLLIRIIKTIIGVLNQLKILMLVYCLYPSLVVNYFTYKAKDFNILHNKPLSDQKVIAVNAEESLEYVEKVKRIKNKLPGTAFSTILLAGLSASLNDYFKKKCSQPPQYLTLAMPVDNRALELRSLVPGEVDINDIDINNSYSLVLMKLPVTRDNDKKSMCSRNTQVLNRLQLINKETHILKTSLEYQINLFFMQVLCAVLPQFLLKSILDMMHCTTVVSILAAPPKISSSNQQLVVTDLLPWVAHVHPIGTSVGIFTYDDRLVIGVNVDKAFISDRNDAQEIADNIYKYLDILEKEVEEHCNGKS